MMHYQSVMERCRNAQGIFQAKAFREWRGLPPTCRMSELMRTWRAADEGSMVGNLGERRIPTSYRYCTVPNYSVPVRVWHLRGRPVQIDAEDFSSAIIDIALLSHLGPPDEKLDARFGYTILPEGEWFYGKRGLSLIYAQAENRIVAVAAFVPMDLKHYVERVRIDHSTEQMLRTY